ncbi:thermonuclease family protein [Roseovarius ramblicola]|uniref:Thermonuclease family protein n=1 Tax=Roseovarius ramblicola TaxID=2022336 RepID=A0ABV5I206_9RHOB
MLRISLLIVLTMVPAISMAQGIGGTVRVVDGDTFDVGGTRVRLHGVDAPEDGQPCTDADGVTWDCGAWVTQQVRRRIGARMARCDAVDIDRYGRTVATCTVAGQDVGRMLVSEGLALAYRKYSMAYDLDEKRAVIAGRGLHAHRFDRPAEFRRASRADRAAQGAAPDPDCLIKGNISRSGKRIHHLPGQADYARTVIRPAQGERWFCSEGQARAAGWRRARR